jgi:hypothetical protein
VNKQSLTSSVSLRLSLFVLLNARELGGILHMPLVQTSVINDCKSSLGDQLNHA